MEISTDLLKTTVSSLVEHKELIDIVNMYPLLMEDWQKRIYVRYFHNPVKTTCKCILIAEN